MGVFVDLGPENFQSALQSAIYVDKSGLLEYTNSVLDSAQRYLCVSRPRRFGKSMTADMLSAYYAKGYHSKEIFKDLRIAKAPDFEKHLNQYHVIQVDVNTFLHRWDGDTGRTVAPLRAVKLFQLEIIEELRKFFPDSVKETDVDLPAVLTHINADTDEKFIIIIDEWDALFREEKTDIAAQEEYIHLLRGLFKDATSKRFLKLAYLTGILPIKKYGTQSALNNFDEFTMIHSSILSEYVGFTKEEVRELYASHSMDFSEAERWYDGYVLADGLHIYNPKSVVDSIRLKKIANYWTRTETYEILRHYILMNFAGLKDVVVQMLSGGHCKINPGRFQNDMTTFKSRDDVLVLLIHLGYLAYDVDRKEVYIPNEEVREEFRNAIEDTDWTPVINAINASDRLLLATWEMDEAAVAAGIDRVHADNCSILEYNNENSLSCVITLAYYNAVNEYTLIREMPAGKGYADIVFLPRRNSDKPAMLVELKYNQSARSAIAQIKDRQYSKALEEYKGKLLLVGINYDKETKVHQCEIEKMEW